MEKNGHWQAKERYPLVDQIRGIAVVLMIIYHFCYNLNYFGHIKVNMFHDPFWWTFPRVIVFLFLFVVGLSLPLAHPLEREFDYKKYFFRVGKIGAGALLISVGTYLMFPSRWVYFGTLHCIVICSFLVWPLLHRPKTALILCIVIAAPWIAGYQYPWFTMAHKSMDYIPALPWVSIVCLGIFAYSLSFHRLTITMPIYISVPLKFLGKNSLLVYLAHQPLLFGCTYGFTWLMNRIMVS